MEQLEAAIGLGNIEIYHQILEKRRNNLLYMLDKFKEFKPYLYTIKEEAHEKIGPHAFPIVLGEKIN